MTIDNSLSCYLTRIKKVKKHIFMAKNTFVSRYLATLIFANIKNTDFRQRTSSPVKFHKIKPIGGKKSSSFRNRLKRFP